MQPADIDKIEFSTTRVREGYDQDEVDNYLDRVRDAWQAQKDAAEKATRENITLAKRLAEAERIADAYEVTAPIPAASPAESATRILEFAQRTAEQAVADAKAEASRIVDQAKSVQYAVEHETAKLERKRDGVRNELRDFHRKHLNELEETGG